MSNLVKYDPFEELRSLQRRFFGDDLVAPAASVNMPTTDVYLKDNDLIVEAHLPNFAEEDVDIQIDGNNLVVSAERHEQEKDKQKKYVVRESASSFYRSISLPERADIENIEADLDGGILTVKIPLTPLPEPKKIVVKRKK